MKIKLMTIALLAFFLICPAIVNAESSYGKIDVYYNGEHFPNTEIPKPTLKIGETFTISIEMTMYQECQVIVELSELGTEDYIVVEGPADFDEYHTKVYEENEIHVYKWHLNPTEKWAGGSMPIDFHYTIYDKEETEPLVNSGFTAVLPYISTEYYETPEPTQSDQPENETNQTPAFTLPAALLAIALIALRKRC